jgi:hypothetical protein
MEHRTPDTTVCPGARSHRTQRKIRVDNHLAGSWRGAVSAIWAAAFLPIWQPNLALGQQNNVGLPVVPLHISNHFDTTDHLFVWIFGVTNQAATGIPIKSQVIVTNRNGDIEITPAVPGDMPRSFSIDVGTDTEIDMMLPKLSGIRIYTSLGAGIKTQNGGIAGNGLATPDVENPGDPNFGTIFDSVETTWEDQAPIEGHPEIKTNLGTNVTEVDLFGLVQQYTVEGTDPATLAPNTKKTAGFLSKARRAALFNTLNGFGPPWSNLILTAKDGTDLRAVAPYHGIHGTLPPFPLFPADQLKDYTRQVFSKYMTAPPLTTTVSVSECDNCPTVTYNFKGSTSGGEFVFSDPSKGGPIFSLAEWSTLDAYEGHFPFGTLKPGGSDCIVVPLSDACLAALAVEAKLQGAVMRTNLLVNTNLDACDKKQFYVNPPVNMYSLLWHTSGIDGKAYGFGFDDTCDQSSFELIFNPTKLTITLPGDVP